MSVPGLNGVGPDIAAAIRLAQNAAPAAPRASNGAVSPRADPPEDKAARHALNELLNGAAPSDASIGLYCAAPDAAALAVELQAYQASLIIGLRTMLRKLRRLPQDRRKILPVPVLEEGGTREDEQA
ncbi:hypothetical protein [Rhodoblastus sp.]|uniref:hypothetical protein n=1 Tax=Rhodoblastus sp. TaxID=1962975 RepID=UPI002631B24D|nr:hypothetical protein [Rhodoblastus sp.]